MLRMAHECAQQPVNPPPVRRAFSCAGRASARPGTHRSVATTNAESLLEALMTLLCTPIHVLAVLVGWVGERRTRREMAHQAWVDAWDAKWTHA